MSPPRLISPRPTKSAGKTSRSPKIAWSTSTYLRDAMLPSRTTSQSGPMSAATARIVRVDVHGRERSQRAERDRRVGKPQSGGRGNNEDSGAAERGGLRGPREGPAIRQLAAKIEPAQEREYIAEGRARARAELNGKIERRALGHDNARAVTGAIRGREEKNLRAGHRSLVSQMIRDLSAFGTGSRARVRHRR